MTDKFSLFNDTWALWQNILVFVLLMVVAFFLVFIIIMLLVQFTAGRIVKRRIEREKREVQKELDLLALQSNTTQEELKKAKEKLEEEQRKAKEAEELALQTRKEIEAKEKELEELLIVNEMEKKELVIYQKVHGTNVAEDIVVNIITDNTLKKSRFAMDPSYEFRVPVGEVFSFNAEDIRKYIKSKPKVEISLGTGQKPDTYKVSGKTFAFLYSLETGHYKVSFKCGPKYGHQLSSVFTNNVAKTKFPYGLLWFMVSNETLDCSLELIKQLIDISYKIASLGY